MAIWKASVEWGSELHGDGTGDAHQSTTLGSGGANFDVSIRAKPLALARRTTTFTPNYPAAQAACLHSPRRRSVTVGVSATTPLGHGMMAPGTSISGVDLQGVACHEYGHALGLGHSTSGGATMAPSISGSGVVTRSIATDDKNGVKAIYVQKVPRSPTSLRSRLAPARSPLPAQASTHRITSSGSRRKPSGGNGTPIKVTGLSSNGTTITTSIPSAAGPGDVLVRRNSTAHSGLSNSFPSDLSGGGGGTGGAPVIATVSPSSIDAVVVDGPCLYHSDRLGLYGYEPSQRRRHSTFDLPAAVLDSQRQYVGPELPAGQPAWCRHHRRHQRPRHDADTIQVNANASTTVELKGSTPAFLIQGLGLQTILGGQVGDIVILTASPELIATNLPGIVNLAIGNNYSSLFILNTSVIPAQGFVEVTTPMAGLPIGLTIHTQGAGLSLSSGFALPASGSNVQSGTILF